MTNISSRRRLPFTPTSGGIDEVRPPTWPTDASGNTLNPARGRVRGDLRRCGVHTAIAVMTSLLLLGPIGAAEVQTQSIPDPPQKARVYSGRPIPPAVTVVLTPSSVTIQPGALAQFAAKVTGTSNTAVVWTATDGTITQDGAYTAGQNIGTYSVTATLRGGTLSAAATVTIQTGRTYVDLNPGDDLQARVNAAAPGTAFRLKPGLYRLSAPIIPKDRDTFRGEPGAIVSGAKILDGWMANGRDWKVTGQTQQLAPHSGATCLNGYPRCRYPEDLFMDGSFLRHVDSRASLGPGRWFFDYANDTIYMRDNPAGHVVETSVATGAFSGSASGVVIQSLVIEKFANNAQAGAVDGRNAPGWTVQESEIRLNHGAGIDASVSMTILNNKLHHNGQLGLHVAGSTKNGFLVEGNEIAYNNQLGFSPGWEAGGAKFAYTDGLVVRNNWAHHNAGPGLWTDIDNIQTLYENNLAEDNYAPPGSTSAAPGIFHEISYSAIIRYNTVRRNGVGFDSWGWGAGILLAASGGTGIEIYGNILENNKDGIMLIQQNRGSGLYGPHLVQNVDVHDNAIRMTEGWTGAVQDIDSPIYTAHNRFHGNSYTLGPNARYFTWMDLVLDESKWRSYGQDEDGTFAR